MQFFDLFTAVVYFDGLLLLIATVIVAGMVRGFTGFGTALVFVPIAATVVEPIWAILMMMSFDALGPLALLPRAWRDGEPKDVTKLGVGALIALPFGVYFLTKMDPVVFRWLVSLLALMMLALLMSGWRYRNPLNAAMTILVGMMGGFFMGIAALPGPPIILSYMSSPRPPQVIRGNTMMYLFLVDILSLIVFAVKGLLVLFPLIVGVLLALPYALGGWVGQRIFNPEKEKVYRRVAYVLIASSAISGLPIY